MRIRGIAIALCLMLPAGAFAAGKPEPHAPAAQASVADYRYGDVLWENDRIAFRIYGHALEAAEPPSGSGIDAWGKSVPWPFMAAQLRVDRQHEDLGAGVDFYDVGGGRGAGGLGIWYDNKLWTSRNYRTARILDAGPSAARFVVTYAPWPVDVGRQVSETREFSLPMGTNFTRMVSTLRSNSSAPLVVAIGIGKRTTGRGREEVLRDPAHGVLSVWSAPDPQHGQMAVALLFDPAALVKITEDADNYLVLLNEQPGVPFVYYAGAAWDRGAQFRRHEDWTAYVLSQHPDFAAGTPTGRP